MEWQTHISCAGQAHVKNVARGCDVPGYRKFDCLRVNRLFHASPTDLDCTLSVAALHQLARFSDGLAITRRHIHELQIRLGGSNSPRWVGVTSEALCI